MPDCGTLGRTSAPRGAASNLIRQGNVLRIRIARSAAELEGLRPAWESLYRQGEYALFQSFEWNLLAARLLPDREAPFVVHAENDSGAALLPAAVTGGKLTFLGDELFDYRDLLALGDEAPLRSAWEVLAGTGFGLSVASLAGAAVAQRWTALGFRPSVWSSAPQAVAAQVSAGQFAATHNRLARSLRRILRAGATLKQHSGANSDLVRWIYAQKAQQPTAGEPNLFLDPARVSFMVSAAALSVAPCEIFTFEADSSVVAALVTFRDTLVRRFYTVWYDRQWAHFSPGTALVFGVAQRSLQEGLDCDYMTGDQFHKRRLATSLVPLYEVEVSAEELWRVPAMAHAENLAA